MKLNCHIKTFNRIISLLSLWFIPISGKMKGKDTQTIGIRTECEPIGIKNNAYSEMLLGFVVLIEVDAGSAVLLHGITGQQLSDEHNTQGYTSGNVNKV